MHELPTVNCEKISATVLLEFLGEKPVDILFVK